MQLSLRALLVAAAVSALSVVACSREVPAGEGAFANDSKVTPVAKGGTVDDSVKPVVGAPKPGVVAKGGTVDDSVKPVVAPVVPKGGVPDDSIKPGAPGSPRPVPTVH